MVKLKQIKEANSSFARERNEDLIFVFAGATSGIGAATLEKLATMVQSARFYIAGRSAARFASQRTKLEYLNPNLAIVFFECDISLFRGVDAFAKAIASIETKVDYLFMSQGKLPLTGSEFTNEGLETCFTLSYYTRALLISSLLPLLSHSLNPRVLSVLNGGKEKALNESDLALAKPGSWSPLGVITQATTLTTLALDHLSSQHQNITFIHAFPGLVRTDISTHMVAPQGAGWFRRIWAVVLRAVVGTMIRVLGVTTEVSGERQAYHLTGLKVQPGLSLVDEHSDVVPVPAVVLRYRAEGWPERVWEFTVGVFEKVFSVQSEAAGVTSA
ncbi:3-keto-steroid reductase [Madurella mycetomatis]|uniref:3-keto-steroid reductase n=1 Tax=Madurella mycetomatis TaxID=100816 RepID=A0A175VZ62_9PEZI|nr:3-keto-steroid reductase [Madurella mycetomatis]